MLLDVEQYTDFDRFRDQSRHQVELNEDININFLKTTEECVECGRGVALYSDALGDNVVTDHCSNCWAGTDLVKQLICFYMQGHKTEQLTANCLCCSEPFCQKACIHDAARKTLYCDYCWFTCRHRCKATTESVVFLQRWWRRCTKAAIAVCPTGLSPSPNWSPETSSPLSAIDVDSANESPIRAKQVNRNATPLDRYKQARNQSMEASMPNDHMEWVGHMYDKSPRVELRRSDRTREEIVRWKPDASEDTMDTSMSSSVSEGEMQRALQDHQPLMHTPKLVMDGASNVPQANTFVGLDLASGRMVMSAQESPDEMKLMDSAKIHAAAKGRSRQSRLDFDRMAQWKRISSIVRTRR